MHEVAEAARRRGTTVSVRGPVLQHARARAIPARHALRVARDISDVLVSIALARRDVRLRVTADGKEVMALAPGATRCASASPGSGAPAAVGRFLDVDDRHRPDSRERPVERPADVGTASRRTALIVNGRAVRDIGLTRAAETAYRTALAAGLRPSFAARDPAAGRRRGRQRPSREGRGALSRSLGQSSARSNAPCGARSASWTARRSFGRWRAHLAGARRRAPGPAGAAGAPARAVRADAPLFGSRDADVDDDATLPAAEDIPVPPLLQLRRTYLMFEHDDGVVLIDQHSAHERVLYERFMQQLTSGGATVAAAAVSGDAAPLAAPKGRRSRPTATRSSDWASRSRRSAGTR